MRHADAGPASGARMVSCARGAVSLPPRSRSIAARARSLASRCSSGAIGGLDRRRRRWRSGNRRSRLHRRGGRCQRNYPDRRLFVRWMSGGVSAGMLAVSAGLSSDGSSVFSTDFSADFSADADLAAFRSAFRRRVSRKWPSRRCPLPARLPPDVGDVDSRRINLLGFACDTAAAAGASVPGLVVM